MSGGQPDPANSAFTAARLITVVPSVFCHEEGSSTALTADVSSRIERVVVDHHLHLPDMFEITFSDRDLDLTGKSGLTIGAVVEICAGAAEDRSAEQLVIGEVTAIEGDYGQVNRTVVRGYTTDHRLQRNRRSRTFLNMTDSDIAQQLAQAAGLEVTVIDTTRTVHDVVMQVNQTDWDFLRSRAAVIGYDFGVTAGKFFYRKASTPASTTSVPLAFPQDLHSFLPRVTAGNLAEKAEVRVWDPLAVSVTSTVVPTSTASVRLTGTAPDELASTFVPLDSSTPSPVNEALGPAPVANGHVISDNPVATGAAATSAGAEAAAGAAEHTGSTFAEAEGAATGDPALRPGVVVEISGVGTEFSGEWTITRTRHLFSDDGYHTTFEVSGRQVRSLLGLTGGVDDSTRSRIPGLVCAVVTNINDPLGKGRVRLTLPWLSPAVETDWAPVAHAGAGPRSGALFLPEVGDEVLAGFEFGDPHRPYVLGGILNNNSGFTLGGDPVKQAEEAASVVWRGIATPSGNRLAFHDELEPGADGQPPVGSDLVLGTGSGSLSLAIDQIAGTVVLRCAPAPPDSKAEAGQLTIECGAAGKVDITTGAGGTVNISGPPDGAVNVSGGRIGLTAQQSITIESDALVEIKGNPIKLN